MVKFQSKATSCKSGKLMGRQVASACEVMPRNINMPLTFNQSTQKTIIASPCFSYPARVVSDENRLYLNLRNVNSNAKWHL